MAARHVARDRQPEPDAAGGRVARGIQPEERLENMIAFARRDARPVIVHQNVDTVLYRTARQPDMAAVTRAVGDQVAEAAAQRIRPDRYDQLAGLVARQ